MTYIEHTSLLEARAKPLWQRCVSDSLLVLAVMVLVTSTIAFTNFYTHTSIVLFIYLFLILILATTRGLYAALLASLLASFSCNYFLFSPPYMFSLDEEDDIATLWTFLMVAVTVSQLSWVLRRRIEQARSREQELHLRYEHAQELTAQQERQHLARELHDSVSQDLYSISLGTHTAREALESNDPEQAMASMEFVLTLTEVGLAEMRALIFELRPEFLETEGLLAALSRQVAVLRTRYQLSVEADLQDEPVLTLEHKHTLYRIAQEALHNIIKHAHASTVTLRLIQQENEIVLEVHDDGQGFDPTNAFPGHFGLRSMQERATKMEGTLTIESTPRQGTGLRLQIPQDIS